MATLKQLQRRATNKRSSLKTRGATQEVLRTTPIMPWQAVKLFDANMRRAYGKQLREWTQTPITVLESGEVVERDVLSRAKRAERKYNRRALAERKRIDAIRAPNEFGSVTDTMWTTARVNPKTGHYTGRRGTVFGAVSEMHVTQAPKTRATAIARMERLEKAANQSYDEKRRQLKRSLVEMLDNRGMTDMAKVVNAMTSDQFDVLVNRSNIFDMLGEMAMCAKNFVWSSHMSGDTWSRYNRTLTSTVAQARTVGTNYNANSIQARLEKQSAPKSLGAFNKKQAEKLESYGLQVNRNISHDAHDIWSD